MATGRIVNLGSLCIDRVFRVDHVARAGETISAVDVQVFAGGKGLNQSLAARRAGAAVLHAGCVGPDGAMLTALLAAEGVDVTQLRIRVEQPTGNAVIQVTPQGDNAIVIVGGANRSLDIDQIDAALDAVGADDWLLLQNEINALGLVLQRAAARGLRVCLNCAPFDASALDYPLADVALLVVNEIEAHGLSGEPDPHAALTMLGRRYPAASIVLTLGEQGLIYVRAGEVSALPAFSVEAVDGTGAGDAFTGFLLAELLGGATFKDALLGASAAGAITAARLGAAPAIPHAAEVRQFLRERW